MLIFGIKLKFLDDYKSFISSNFDNKAMGEVDVILGVKVLEIQIASCIHNKTILERMLKEIGHFYFTSVSTPYDGHIHFTKNNEQSVTI